jgi:hypothetical protein
MQHIERAYSRLSTLGRLPLLIKCVFLDFLAKYAEIDAEIFLFTASYFNTCIAIKNWQSSLYKSRDNVTRKRKRASSFSSLFA